jgi:CBS-domain-containing membrane protein
MSPTVHIPIDEAGPAVQDVMLRDARTVDPGTPVAEVRAMFASPGVKLMLVADGERFLGTVGRDALPEGDEGTIAALVSTDAPRLRPEDPVARALEIVETTGVTRIPVVDGAERLQGLVCFNRSHSAFCTSP